MSFSKYKYLLNYRYSEIIMDVPVEFCEKFLFGFDKRRMREQMIQAARSGKQNIAEGYSMQSLEGYIKLLGVAHGSFKELLEDYQDFLRQHHLEVWPKEDQRIRSFRAFRAVWVIPNKPNTPKLPNNPQEAANFLLTLCHQTTYLLSRQIAAAEVKFIKEGGYSENLFKKRMQYKIGR